MGKEKKKYCNLTCTKPVKEQMKQYLENEGGKEYQVVDKVLSGFLSGTMIDVSKVDENRLIAIKAILNQ